MQIIESIEEMQLRSEASRLKGDTISLVPTMGFFHEGHLELMRVAKKHSDLLIVSLFVNPKQFGPSEDYDEYPRDTDGDLEKARETGVDIVFMPAVEEMYPPGFQSTVHVEKVTRHLCGLSRPGHFDGVTTVVMKLFNITKPHVAVFGQKDYQQLTVISRMVMDFNMDVRLVGVPTVREDDGLALSSRNKYLGEEERLSALCLSKAMALVQRLFSEGETKTDNMKKEIEALIKEHSFTSIDYISFCDPVTLETVDSLGNETLLALAVRIGGTRIIDNCILR